MTKPWINTFKRARRSATSLVGLCATEPASAIATICQALNGDAPKVQWDCLSGWRAINDEGERALQSAVGGEDDRLVEYPSDALRQARQMPSKSIVFMLNLHRFMADPTPMAALTVQGLWNLREPYKGDRRTLVMVSPDITLPPELTQDVLLIYEDMPTKDDHAAAIRELAEGNDVKLSDDTIERAASQLVGLNSYAGEQASAEAMIDAGKEGINIEYLIDRKRSMIDAVPGLKVYSGKETFADIGGNDAVKTAMKQKIAGQRPFTTLVWIDEIEKAMAGSSGLAQDTSGASQAILQYFLTEMQDNEWTGDIYIGHPGCSKSLVAKAVGNEAGVPTIGMDLSAFKGSFVGQTEEQTRAAFRVLRAIGGKRVHVIATCNGISELKPEMIRRFTNIVFFDLPTAAEQEPIWKIFLKKFDLKPPHAKEWQALRAETVEWTGAEIGKCASMAWEFGIPLREAAKRIVPVKQQAPEQVKRLREECSGRYLSAQYEGFYQYPTTEPVETKRRGRKLAVDPDVVG